MGGNRKTGYGLKRPHSSKYPWHKWLAITDRPLTLKKGTDYQVRTYMFAQTIRNAARPDRWNVKVDIRIAEDEKSLTLTVAPLVGNDRNGNGRK